MTHILNAHIPLNLTTTTSTRIATNLMTYVDTVSQETCHEILNAHYHQYMPTLIKLDDFTEDQKFEASQVISGRDTDRYVDYGKCWLDGLPRCTVQLLTDRNTRRAIIHFTDAYPRPSCLASVQFLIRNNELQMIATFRSWELKTFAKYDVCLLLEMAKEVSRHLHGITLGTLYINAASAHVMSNVT